MYIFQLFQPPEETLQPTWCCWSSPSSPLSCLSLWSSPKTSKSCYSEQKLSKDCIYMNYTQENFLPSKNHHVKSDLRWVWGLFNMTTAIHFLTKNTLYFLTLRSCCFFIFRFLLVAVTMLKVNTDSVYMRLVFHPVSCKEWLTMLISWGDLI